MPMLEPGPMGLDLTSVHHVVHTLHSSSNSLGALRLAGLCAEVEQALRRGAGVAALRPRLEVLRGEMQRVQDGVQRQLSEQTV
jgi:HPt (histidine-containing phosphotransfer) domain-containing protein